MLKSLTGKLRMTQELVGHQTHTGIGLPCTIFRQIKRREPEFSDKQVTFVVKFKFARLSHKANKLVSLLAMLLIAGFPGFVEKIYALQKETGYWQGIPGIPHRINPQIIRIIE
jgi:hypothetical protein